MEMTTLQFLKPKDKMCQMVPSCLECPIGKFEGCSTLIKSHPEEVVDIVSKWADNYATYLADFYNKFPNAMVRVSSKYPNPIPTVCRRHIYGTGIKGCMEINECISNKGLCEQCWKEFYI